jgi:hypothetical protein
MTLFMRFHQSSLRCEETLRCNGKSRGIVEELSLTCHKNLAKRRNVTILSQSRRPSVRSNTINCHSDRSEPILCISFAPANTSARGVEVLCAIMRFLR